MNSDSAHSIVRYDQGRVVQATDELAVEEPLEIRVRGRALSITMRTPGHDDELAAGFLVSEGLISHTGQIVAIEPCAHPNAGNIVNVFLAANVKVDFEKLTRHVFASSSCGLCGKASIDAIQAQFPPIDSNLSIPAAMLLELPGKLRKAQPTFARTGGLHGAAIFDISGNLIVAREDVGRHNAVDKVIGHGLLRGLLPFDRHVLMVSGRASFEIMQKALSARLPVVAAVSAPSTLAAQFATDSGMTLVGFLREQRMNVYAGAERVLFSSDTG